MKFNLSALSIRIFKTEPSPPRYGFTIEAEDSNGNSIIIYISEQQWANLTTSAVDAQLPKALKNMEQYL